MKEASSTFLEQFGGIGSPSITCNCGRRHHAVGSAYIEPKEVEEMRADAKENPTKVVLTDDDGVSAKIVGGLTIVPDCQCGVMAKIEDIVWAERAAIISYYQQRRRQDAESMKGLDDAAAK
jgi:hypothetical protein